MARTFKARSQAIENITKGAEVTSVERTIAGAAPPVFTATWGNTENIAVGTAYGADENFVVTATSLMLKERIGA